jgi:hypothetical protein
MDIFCVKCRKKVQPTNVSAGVVTFTRKKTGCQGTRFSLQAVCPNCGINMKRFIKQEDMAKYAPVPEKKEEEKKEEQKQPEVEVPKEEKKE